MEREGINFPFLEKRKKMKIKIKMCVPFFPHFWFVLFFCRKDLVKGSTLLQI